MKDEVCPRGGSGFVFHSFSLYALFLILNLSKNNIMKKKPFLTFRKALALCALSALPVFGLAANKKTTVEQVSGTVTLSEDIDYIVTGEEPFAAGAVIDITNTENAVVILTQVKPSKALTSYLGNIRINGAKAVKNTNCMVKIYADGCIILPHGNSIKPLVVYTETDQQGESASFGVGNRQSLANHAMNNKIQSFTLKRGYMAWFATKSGSTNPGYNRIFIADKEDIEVNLPAILSKSISALRVSQWNDTSKKGYAGWDPAYNEPLNTTWCYSWDAGINIWDDREYVTHHHHEGWPGITDVGNNGTSPSILGNNEPDNTGDEREQVNTVAEVLATWPEMMATGRRLGSPAVAGNYSWLYEFMDSIDARGWRCDFVAVHSYWYSDWSSWQSTLSGIRNRTGRPLWITEMNYGANWTGWPGSDRTGSAANYAIQTQHMNPVIDGLENTPWLERYAVYNWVEDCRMVIDGSMKLTPFGEYYANKESGIAYNSAYEVVPKLPKMTAPDGLSLQYDKKETTATLQWNEYNGEYNASMKVMRRKSDTSGWEAVAEIPLQEEAATYTWQDTEAISGYSYRVVVVDAAGKEYKTNIQTAVITDLEAGDGMLVDGVERYVGGNVFVNGDFDFGTSGWTDGTDALLSSEYYSVFPVGGVDGKAYLQAHGHEISMNKVGAVKTLVEVVPGQEYYASLSIRNAAKACVHRLSLTIDGSAEDSVALNAPTQMTSWTSTTATFNSGTYSKVMFSARRMEGLSQIDKVILCPLFKTREEALADGISCMAKRGAVVVEWLKPVHPELAEELQGVLDAPQGEGEAAFYLLQDAVDAALQAAAEKPSVDSLLAVVEVLAAYNLPGGSEMAAAAENARAARAAADRVAAYAALREAVDDCFPYVYADDYIKYPSFEAYTADWKLKSGSYTGGSQIISTLGGKRCWSAMWTGISATEGAAKNMQISQVVEGLSHGLYALECKATTDHYCLSDQHGWMVSGTDTLNTPMLSFDHLDIPAVPDSLVWETLATPAVYVEEGGEVTVGFTGSKQGATDNAWKELCNPTATGDLREGWWAATEFTLRFLPMYRTAVDATGWGVICLPRQIVTSADVRLYRIAGILSDYTALCLEEVGEETVAGEPYIFYTTDSVVVFHERGEAVAKASTVNDMRGFFTTNARVPAGSYAFSEGKWYRVASSDRPQIGDFHAFLRQTTGLTVHDSWAGRTLPIEGAAEENADGIGGVTTDSALGEDADVYTIDGRRATDTDSQRGVYIRVSGGKSQKVVK